MLVVVGWDRISDEKACYMVSKAIIHILSRFKLFDVSRVYLMLRSVKITPLYVLVVGYIVVHGTVS
jgi:hypothetical protein